MKKTSKLLFTGIAATSLMFSSVSPALVSAEVYDEPPAYMEVVELINEFGEPVYIDASDDALIAKETKRIKDAIAAQEGETEEPAPEPEPEEPAPEPEPEEPAPEPKPDKPAPEADKEPKPETEKPAPEAEKDPEPEVEAPNKENSQEDADLKVEKEPKSEVEAPNKENSQEDAQLKKEKVEKVEKVSKPAYQVKNASKDEAKKFVEDNAKDIQAVASEENLYASTMIAQAIMATSYGKSYLASKDMNNLMGIKGSYNGNSVLLNSSEGKQSYRQYDSVKEGFEDYVKLMNKDMYKASSKDNSKTYGEAVDGIAKNYAQDKDYASKLKSIIEMHDLTQFDK